MRHIKDLLLLPGLSVLCAFLLHFCAIPFVNAELYVTNPRNRAPCTGGQACTVTWLDDGQVPLLATIGPCTVGLYHGQEQLVQTIDPVDVSSVHSLTFLPDAQAGPDSDTYYIAFTSLSLPNPSNASFAYQAFSPFFALSGMSGSFDTPVASDTSSKPIPSTLTQSTTSPASTTSISVIGTLQSASSITSLTPSVTPSSTISGFTTSRTSPSASSLSSGTSTMSSSASSTTSNAARRHFVGKQLAGAIVASSGILLFTLGL